MMATGQLQVVETCRVTARFRTKFKTLSASHAWARISVLQLLPGIVMCVCNISLIIISYQTYNYRRQLVGAIGTIMSIPPMSADQPPRSAEKAREGSKNSVPGSMQSKEIVTVSGSLYRGSDGMSQCEMSRLGADECCCCVCDGLACPGGEGQVRDGGGRRGTGCSASPPCEYQSRTALTLKTHSGSTHFHHDGGKDCSSALSGPTPDHLEVRGTQVEKDGVGQREMSDKDVCNGVTPCQSLNENGNHPEHKGGQSRPAYHLINLSSEVKEYSIVSNGGLLAEIDNGLDNKQFVDDKPDLSSTVEDEISGGVNHITQAMCQNRQDSRNAHATITKSNSDSAVSIDSMTGHFPQAEKATKTQTVTETPNEKEPEAYRSLDDDSSVTATLAGVIRVTEDQKEANLNLFCPSSENLNGFHCVNEYYSQESQDTPQQHTLQTDTHSIDNQNPSYIYENEHNSEHNNNNTKPTFQDSNHNVNNMKSTSSRREDSFLDPIKCSNQIELELSAINLPTQTDDVIVSETVTENTATTTASARTTSPRRRAQERSVAELRPTIMLVLVTSCTLFAELTVTVALFINYMNKVVQRNFVEEDSLVKFILASNLVTLFSFPMNFVFFCGLSRPFRNTLIDHGRLVIDKVIDCWRSGMSRIGRKRL